MTKKHERRHTPWRDNIEAMTVAIIMAVVLKYFIVEAYKIPTGSMQPTLMGQPFDQNRDGRVDGGVFDRILVDKLSYHFRDPERWEIAVFRYPLEELRQAPVGSARRADPHRQGRHLGALRRWRGLGHPAPLAQRAARDLEGHDPGPAPDPARRAPEPCS